VPRNTSSPLTDSAARDPRFHQQPRANTAPQAARGDGTTGSHVPCKSPDHARATSTPDTTWPVSRHPPDSSRGRKESPVSMPPIIFRRVISGSLALAFVIHTCRAHGATFPRRSPPRLLTAAARGGLRPPPAERPRRATKPKGPAPPSPAQHRIQRSAHLQPTSFNVRGTPERDKQHARVWADRRALPKLANVAALGGGRARSRARAGLPRIVA
jgi:hypothetical protein